MGERLADMRGGFMNTALLVAAMSVGLLSFVGLGHVSSAVSLGLDRIRNNRIATRQKQVLAEEFRVPVASILGIDPDSVTVNDLQLAAQVNPQVAGAISKVEHERSSNNRASMIAAGAGAAVGFIPGAAMIAQAGGQLAQGAMHVGATIAADVGARTVFDKDVLEVLDVMEIIDAKMKQGQLVTWNDMMMLRIAQDETLQKQIKKHTGGEAFHKMNPAQQQVVMQALPEMHEAAAYDANLLNGRRVELSSLVLSSPGAQHQRGGGWAARVGGPRVAQDSFSQPRRSGSFVQQVEARRAAAPVMAGKIV